MENIIIVHYVGVGNLPEYQVRELMSSYLKLIKNDEEGVTHYMIPSNCRNTRIECINPRLVSKKDYSDAKAALDKAKAAAEEFALEKRDI